MHLKVLEVRKDPPIVHDHDVPVLVSSVGLPRPGLPPRSNPPVVKEGLPSQEHLDLEDEEPFEVDSDADWDLTTRQVRFYSYYIDCSYLFLLVVLYLHLFRTRLALYSQHHIKVYFCSSIASRITV